MDDKYFVTDEDFSNEFHKVVFGTIYKVHELGAKAITLQNINDYLASKPKSQGIYQAEKGDDWLLEVSTYANELTFDYYYNRLKKMTLLRVYYQNGVDVSDIYDDDNILDAKKKEMQEAFLDNSSLTGLADLVDDKISRIRMTYADQDYGQASLAGDGIFELIQKFKEHPEVGVPLYGPLINAVTRGARLKKFYLRSAATGIGKTRSMIADCCYIGCNKIYDDMFGWIKTGVAQPVLFITTEQEKEEVQTMMLAFLANVNEEHIINNYYEGDEDDRVQEAAKILKDSPIFIEELPDFSL